MALQGALLGKCSLTIWSVYFVYWFWSQCRERTWAAVLPVWWYSTRLPGKSLPWAQSFHHSCCCCLSLLQDIHAISWRDIPTVTRHSGKLTFENNPLWVFWEVFLRFFYSLLYCWFPVELVLNAMRTLVMNAVLKRADLGQKSIHVTNLWRWVILCYQQRCIQKIRQLPPIVRNKTTTKNPSLCFRLLDAVD